MSVSKYLRDARHMDKFMYSLMDERFYAPFEMLYKPLQEYVALVTGLLKDFAHEWMITRDGFWFVVHPQPFILPAQGWKVHVSAMMDNGASILQKAAKIALANKVSFKFALDQNVVAMMSSKRWPRGGSGKFITMYPPDLPGFKNLLEQLYAELHSEDGPYILSDKRYKDCRVLYYRYGEMARGNRIDIMGQKIPVLISPDGEAVPDIRTPYFNPPHWITDPFPSEKPERRGEIVLNGKYLVKKALSFSNSGGVYLAEDRDTGGDVVIKEARAHTAMDDKGNDAIKFLKKEHEILGLLQDTGIAPRPIDAFDGWENFFLVEEFVEGIDIRSIMLTESPLLRARPSLDDTAHYYEVCKKIFRRFAQAVDLLHRRGIVFGDLNAKNLKVRPSTYAVKLIDFEGAFRPGVDEPTYMFTPGFKSEASIRKNAQGFDDDLYALAANMLYMLFPIAAFGSLRADLFDSVLKMMLSEIGWSQTEVFNIISGLAKNEITCTRACDLLDKPASILPPNYIDDVEAGSCDKICQELGCFILANMHTGRKDSLFPADPFIHKTNPLSLGFGACGVLYALKKCGFEIPRPAFDWLEKELDRVRPEDLPPGLLTGASGIAWTLWELGFESRAVEFMKMANQSAILKNHHSYFYGMAGIGMANLYLYLRTNQSEYLAIANELGDFLLRTAQEDKLGIYWEGDGLLQLGYGYGQSGVALFFLRLFQLIGKENFLLAGKRALEFDLSYGLEIENGVLSFPRAPADTTLLPYLEEGSAGITKVAIRYGMWDQVENLLPDLHRKYSGFVGLLYGSGSFVDVLTDAFLFSRDPRFIEMAKRPVSGIRDIYLIPQPNGLAVPGDNLFRISCDYATGVAGVLRALHRLTHCDEADFVLDEVVSAGADKDQVHTMQQVSI